MSRICGSDSVVTLCLAVFSIGIASGSLLAARASRGQPNLALVPLGALLMGQDGAFITGSDFLMDGGVTASYHYGELAPE